MRFKRSSSRGSALIFSISLTILSVGLLLLTLFYTRILSSQQEQTAAIGAAALAAAKDLTRVIVDDPNLGFVALCDQAPSGSQVAAQDGFGLPVRGINTILGTVRLEMIIADQLNDDTMKLAAASDYTNAVAAAKRLQQALEKAVSEKTASLKDAYGNPIAVYSDALQAYNDNAIRSNGRSELVANSLTLTLGYSMNALTNTPIPSPRTMDPQLPQSSTSQGVYKPNQSVTYGNNTFVFAGLSNGTNLFSNDKFQTALSSLPFSVPSAIRVQAQQKFLNNAGGRTYTLTTQACAQSGGAAFNPPAPGALVFSFPDGCPTEITTPKSLLLSDFRAQPISTINSGDYPLASSNRSDVSLPSNAGASIKNGVAYGIYLWCKRAGPSLNIQDFLNMMRTAMLPANSTNLPLMVSYVFNSNAGMIQKQVNYLTTIYGSGSDMQVNLVTQNAISFASTMSTYDVAMTINIFQPGDKKGGKHGGEPLTDPRLSSQPFAAGGQAPSQPKLQPVPWFDYVSPGWNGPSGGWAYTAWKVGFRPYNQYIGGDNTVPVIFAQPTATNVGDLRPSYNTNGTAVEIALHKWINSVALAPQ